MQLWKCLTVSPLRSAFLAMHQTTMKTKGQQLQRACKTRWLSSEATVRAGSEILAIWAALKQLSENKNEAICAVLLPLKKTISTWWFAFVNIGTSPDRTEQSFSEVCFDLAQVKTSVELCINMFSDAAAKSELIAKSLVVNLGNLERWMIWLTLCVKWHDVLEEWRKIRKLIIPIHKKGDRNEWTNYRDISLLSLPGRAYAKMLRK